jgi:hypothetical protein
MTPGNEPTHKQDSETLFIQRLLVKRRAGRSADQWRVGQSMKSLGWPACSAWLTMAGLMMLWLGAPQGSMAAAKPKKDASSPQTATSAAASPAPASSATPKKTKVSTQKPPAKEKAVAKNKKPAKAPPIPYKPPAEIPEVTEVASVWRGCLASKDLPALASGLGVEESRLAPLLTEEGVLAKAATECVPYVAATGGEGGAASAILQRAKNESGELPMLDIRKTADGITVTPGACDCPATLRRVLEVPVQDLASRKEEALFSVPGNVRWQLDTLLPPMIRKLVPKQGPNPPSPMADDAGSAVTDDKDGDVVAAAQEPVLDGSASNKTLRIVLARNVELEPEHLHSIEIVDQANGKPVDGAWWLQRNGAPGVFIGMDGLAYERLLWQSPVKYFQKSRGPGPAVTTFRTRVPIVQPKVVQTIAQTKGAQSKTIQTGIPQSSLVPKNSVPGNSKTNASSSKTATATAADKNAQKIRTIKVREYHLGSDLIATKGTEVHAVGEAKVAFAGRSGGYGKLIILDHGLGYTTYYAHLSVIKPEMKPGTTVARGDVIGLVGSTGRSTAPHLHFETRKDGKYIDPFDNSRQLEFWLLSPDDQERLGMELLAHPTAAAQTNVMEDGNHADRDGANGDRAAGN